MSERTITDEARAAFLADLTELSRRHGIELSACDCCGGIGLQPLDFEPVEIAEGWRWHRSDPEGGYVETGREGVHWPSLRVPPAREEGGA
jgi:hypothetical protein